MQGAGQACRSVPCGKSKKLFREREREKTSRENESLKRQAALAALAVDVHDSVGCLMHAAVAHRAQICAEHKAQLALTHLRNENGKKHLASRL